MLSISALNTSKGFAESLADKGISLSLSPDSVLSAVVAACRSPFSETNFAGNIDETGIAYAANITAGDMDGDSIHTLTMDTLVDNLVSLVTPHVNHARSVVSPIVTNMHNAIAARVEGFVPSDPASNYSIKKIDIPAPLKESDLIEAFKQFEGVDSPPHRPTLNIGPMTPAEIGELVAAGFPDCAEDAKRLIAETDPDFLKIVWATFFDTSNPLALSSDGIMSLDPYHRLIATVIGHLATLGLEQKTPDNLVGMTLSELRSTLDTIARWTGSVANYALLGCKNAKQLGQVVIRFNFETRSVLVDSDLYAQFLEAGGSPDVLLACLLDQKDIRGQASLLEYAKEGERSWNEFVVLNGRNHENEMLSYMRSLYTSEIRESMKDIHESEIEFCADKARHIDNVCKKADEIIACASEAELKDVAMMSLCLIAGCRFHFTSAYDLLKEIELTCRATKADPREAAVPAVLNYVVRFLADEINVAK